MSEIGIIGQKYEDRRTKRNGILIERDDKYKTLLMQTDEGKTFNISYGTFKSSWRKSNEPIQTVEEAMEEIEIPVSTEEPVVETPRVEIKVKTKKYELDDFKEIFDNFAKSFLNDSIHMDYNEKKCVALFKFNRSKVIDFYLRNRGYFWIMLPEIVYTSTKWDVELTDVVNTPKNRREISCRLKLEDLPTALENMKDAIIQLICDVSVKEEEE